MRLPALAASGIPIISVCGGADLSVPFKDNFRKVREKYQEMGGVVELYASAPGQDMDKPVKELRAYAKTAELKAGESATVTLTFPVADLASFSEDANAWVVEAGNYKLLVGASSRDIKAELATEVAAQSTAVSSAFKK